MRKVIITLVLVAVAALLPGAVLGKKAPNWQSNLEVVSGGFLLGIRDKMGDMAKDYVVQFVVKAPTGQEYRGQKAVKARYAEFVEVVFPRDFQAESAALASGPYSSMYVIAGKTIITEKFNYQVVQGRGAIQNRQTRFGGK